MDKATALMASFLVLLIPGTYSGAPALETTAPAVVASAGAEDSAKTKNRIPTSKGKEVGPRTSKLYAKKKMAKKYGWKGKQVSCLYYLWGKESAWNHKAKNPHSSAYGIPQAMPGNKMASAGKDWRTNPETQIDWGLVYIKSRYGTPCGAVDHFNTHNWY